MEKVAMTPVLATFCLIAIGPKRCLCNTGSSNGILQKPGLRPTQKNQYKVHILSHYFSYSHTEDTWHMKTIVTWGWQNFITLPDNTRHLGFCWWHLTFWILSQLCRVLEEHIASSLETHKYTDESKDQIRVDHRSDSTRQWINYSPLVSYYRIYFSLCLKLKD